MTAPVEVRRYLSISHFQQDAARMAQAGWFPVAQSETTGGPSITWLTTALIVAFIGLLLFWPLLILALVLLVVAFLARSKELVVTYTPQRTQ